MFNANTESHRLEEATTKSEKELTSDYLRWLIAAMKGFPQMNRLNNFFGRNAVRLFGVVFFVSLLTPRYFAAGETVRFAGIGVSLTAATVHRAIEKWHPTLLIDEADGMLRDNRGHDNLELRNVINSSHLRDHAFTLRCVGENHDPQRFSTWAPKAIALIGKMPDSMMD